MILSLLRILCKTSCVREKLSENKADAISVHKYPIDCVCFDTFTVALESFWETTSTEERVRRTRELMIGGVSFCPLRKKEKNARKAN